MALDRVNVAGTEQDRTPPAVSAARDSQRYLLCPAHGLPVARAAARLTALEDRLSLFLALATVRVDTQGLLLKVKVHGADVMDRDGVALLLAPAPTKEQFPRLFHVWLDGAYNGKDQGKNWIEQQLVLPLAPPHRLQQVLKKVHQSTLEPLQGPQLHAVKVTTLAPKLKNNLT